jgi:16S rRNA (cytosine967-C5)-methyltransferase
MRLIGAQSQLVAAAARLVKPGGRVVFAICSLEPEEAEAALAAATAAGLRAEAITQEDMPWLPAEAFRPDGTLATAPDIWADRGGMDGFFVARFRR